jgi:glycosyltransferase involved in cell wall biosynthesis
MRENETKDLPSISVIVPVKNSAKTIGDLMESLMSLEYDPGKLEILVVDGDSSDCTRKIVEEYPFLFVEEEGKGLNAARLGESHRQELPESLGGLRWG